MNDESLILRDVLRWSAQRGERAAFSDQTRSVSFHEFERRVNRLVAALVRRGLRRGDRIALLGRNSVSYVECVAAASAGFVLVPLNWRLEPAALKSLVRDCRPSAFICDEAHRFTAEMTLLADMDVPVRIALDGPAQPDWLDYEALIAETGDFEPDNDPAPSDPALIIYTSGTTGAPKGVVISQAGLVDSMRASSRFGIGVSETDRVLCVMPLFHVGGLCFYLLASYMAGATVIMRPVFELNQLVDTLHQEKITNVHLVPTMIADLLAHPGAAASARTLRRIVYAGSSMPITLLERAMATFSECDFSQSYGSTEGGVISALGPAEHRAAAGRDGKTQMLQSCGRPVPGSSVRVIKDDDTECQSGELGEVTVRCAGTMSGYWELPERSASAFLDGHLRTGDIGYRDRDGYLYLVDRKNDMIITGGENVFPSEVEQVLYRCPGVLEAAVFGVSDPRWIEKVVAAVVLKDGSQTTAGDILNFTREHLAAYKCPKQVLIMSQLPRTGVGKVSRKELRESFGTLGSQKAKA